jgi:hypothetical protein
MALGFGNFLLNFQTRGTSAILFRQEQAKGILGFLSLMRALPTFNGPQA